jgi:predicted nucleic acid-binding protein
MVKRYLFDTNFLIHLLTGRRDCLSLFKTLAEETEDELYISSIVVCEILSSSKLTTKDVQNITFLLTAFKIISVDSVIAEYAASIRRSIRIKTPDALIAGTCMCSGLILVTENYKDFEKIEGLEILKI